MFSEFGDIPQKRIFSEVLEEIDYDELTAALSLSDAILVMELEDYIA